METRRKRFLFQSLLLFFLFGVILFLHSKLINRINDDAYIHFRIAKHFVQFGQPFFNLNERVMGTSSPVWTLVLFVVFKFFGPSPKAVSILNALLICSGAMFFAFAFTLHSHRFRTELQILCCLIYAGLMLFPSSDLMEISLCMFIVSAALFLINKNHPAGFSLLGISVLIRYEMIVLFVLMSVFALLKKDTGRAVRISGKKIVLFSFLGVFPFLLFQLIFFRTLIPQTVIAKSKVYDLSLSYVMNTLVNGLMPVGLEMKHLSWEICLTLLLLLFLISVVVIFKSTPGASLQFPDLPFLFAISGLLLFVFYLLGRVFLFEWYIPLFSVPILLGFTFWFLAHPERVFRWFGGFMGIALGVILIVGMKNVLLTPADQISDFTHARVKSYLQLGHELNIRYPHQTLLAPEIGALGWEFEGKIIDSVGLVSPEALQYHPMAVPLERSNGAIGAVPPGLVRELKPNLIVAYDVFTEAFRKSPERKEYLEMKRPAFLPEDMRKYPDGIWGCQTLSVFIRK